MWGRLTLEGKCPRAVCSALWTTLGWEHEFKANWQDVQLLISNNKKVVGTVSGLKSLVADMFTEYILRMRSQTHFWRADHLDVLWVPVCLHECLSSCFSLYFSEFLCRVSAGLQASMLIIMVSLVFPWLF